MGIGLSDTESRHNVHNCTWFGGQIYYRAGPAVTNLLHKRRTTVTWCGELDYVARLYVNASVQQIAD